MKLILNRYRDEFSTGYVNTKGHKDVSASQSSLIVSILSAGTFFGALTAAPFADFMGRRLALIASCWVFNVGVILQVASTALPMFIAGRFFAGFGVGLVSALSMLQFAIYPLPTQFDIIQIPWEQKLTPFGH
jgi:SP family sugar:H+ symporter-like MFS transporter